MKKVKYILWVIISLVFIFIIYCLLNPKVTTEIKLANNLNVEYRSDTYLYNLLSITDGTIMDANYLVDTSSLGDKEITIKYKDSNKHKRKYKLTYTVKDSINPILNVNKNIYVVVNSTVDLYKYIFCGDNETRNVKIDINGDYDLSNIGDYPLTITATDDSDNSVSRNTILHVVANNDNNSTEIEGKPINYYIKNYKTGDNQIGIDVSSHQQEIDYNKVKDDGIDFVMIRCGYGPDANMIMTEDSFFEDNYSKAKAAGLRVGIYLYSYATTSDEVDIQTSWLINLLSDKQLDLPIAYDWESWYNFHDCNLNFYDLNDLTDKFLSTMQNNGYQVMNYGSKYYLEDIWNLPKYSVWLAQYNYEPTYSKDYLMWQISETGIVDGINNLVDIDILEK